MYSTLPKSSSAGSHCSAASPPGGSPSAFPVPRRRASPGWPRRAAPLCTPAAAACAASAAAGSSRRGCGCCGCGRAVASASAACGASSGAAAERERRRGVGPLHPPAREDCLKGGRYCTSVGALATKEMNGPPQTERAVYACTRVCMCPGCCGLDQDKTMACNAQLTDTAQEHTHSSLPHSTSARSDPACDCWLLARRCTPPPIAQRTPTGCSTRHAHVSLIYHSEGCAARALLLVAHDQRRCHCHPLHGLAHGADIQVVDEEVAHLCGSLAWEAAVLRDGGAAQCAMDDAGYIAQPG